MDMKATPNAISAFKKSVEECLKTRPEDGATVSDVNSVAFECANAAGDLMKQMAVDGLIVNIENPDNAFKITQRVMVVCVAVEEMLASLAAMARNELSRNN